MPFKTPAAKQGLKEIIVLQVQPEKLTVVIATPDLRGSIQIGSTVVAYATDQLAVLGNAMVKGIKQVSLSELKLITLQKQEQLHQSGAVVIQQCCWR